VRCTVNPEALGEHKPPLIVIEIKTKALKMEDLINCRTWHWRTSFCSS